jgi:hypothetical protein
MDLSDKDFGIILQALQNEAVTLKEASEDPALQYEDDDREAAEDFKNQHAETIELYDRVLAAARPPTKQS